MDNKTILKVEYEIAQIDKLLDETEPLLKLAKMKIPDHIEKSALGLFLHSFYCGVENIMKFIMKSIHGKLPSNLNWHKELLEMCFIETPDKGPLFSENLHKTLDDYLRFRHFIRNNYSYRLDWKQMEPLIMDIGQHWKLVKKHIESFIK